MVILTMLEDHLEKLYKMIALGEERSFVAAAEKMHISQPALSKAIKTIEESIGSDVILRSRDGLKFTEKGNLLYDFVRRLSVDLKDVEQQLIDLDSIAGQLIIGTYETLGISFWPKLLKNISIESPHLSISLVTSNSQSHWKRLESGEFHIILDAEPPLREKYFSKVIYKDKFALFAKKSSEPRFDLSTLCYVKRAYDQKGKSVERNLIEKGFEHRLAYDLDSFTAVKELITEGVCAGVLPLALAATDLKKGTIYQIPNSEFGLHRICATCLESRRNDKRIKYLMKALKEEAH